MNFYDKNYQEYSAALLNQEISTISPQKEAVLRIALVFPNTYEVGMSNLGFQEVYRLFNSHEEVLCERFVLNPPPFHTIFRSQESHRELRDFDVVAFSVSFELDYPNIIHFLQQGQIPSLAAERSAHDPLVVCGGIVTMLNPSPLSPFFDAFLIGEAEFLINDFIEILLKHKQNGLKSPACLANLANTSKYWLPALETAPIKKVVKDSRHQPIHSCVVSPAIHFKNMYLIEVGRACARGCSFCAASHVYRPVKFFEPQTILSKALANPFQTQKIGLIGSALSDYPQLKELCRALVENGCELGLSSFRLDAIDPEFLEILEQSGIKSLTLAPEAGSERLRQIIHKQLTNEQIFASIEAISNSKISALKFYFMIGLPFETMPDIEAIITLMQQIINKLKRQLKISVSINAFIPKPMTPFQWAPMDSVKNIKQKRKFLSNEFRKMKGISLSFGNIKSEILQGLFSIGDAEVGHRLAQAIVSNKQNEFALTKDKQLLEQHVYQAKPVDKELPWDFLLEKSTRAVLAKKWLKLIEENG